MIKFCVTLVALLMWGPTSSATPSACENALLSQPIRVILNLSNLALARKLITPESLAEALQSQPPRNPLAHLTLRAADLPLRDGFDLALRAKLSWPELRSEVDRLVELRQSLARAESQARRETRPIVDPHFVGELYFKYKSTTTAWTLGPQNQLELVTWDFRTPKVRFFSPNGAEKLDLMFLKNSGNDRISVNIAAGRGFRVIATFLKRKRRGATIIGDVLYAQSPAFRGELNVRLQAPLYELLIHQNKAHQVFIYAVEQHGIDVFECHVDRLERAQFIPYAIGLPYLFSSAEDADGNLALFLASGTDLLEFRPHLKSQVFHQWGLPKFPQSLFAHIRPKGDGVAALSFSGPDARPVSFYFDDPKIPSGHLRSDLDRLERVQWLDQSNGELLALVTAVEPDAPASMALLNPREDVPPLLKYQRRLIIESSVFLT